MKAFKDSFSNPPSAKTLLTSSYSILDSFILKNVDPSTFKEYKDPKPKVIDNKGFLIAIVVNFLILGHVVYRKAL